jgi:hypothetical protein
MRESENASNRIGQREGHSLARLIVADEGGQVLPWVVVVLLCVLGTAALVVDVGRAMVVQRELQASTDAAALAAAESVSGTSTAYTTMGTNYSGATGDKNPSYAGVSFSSPVVTGLCLTTVKNWGISCTTSNGTVTIPNAVSVTETASVPTLFAGVFGKPTVQVSATSTAAHARPMPYNIALIVDSTLSMTATDSNCVVNGSTLTQEQCALNGIQNLLNGINTSYDDVALFTFPNVVVGSNAPAGVAMTASGAAQSWGCTTNVASSYQGVSYQYDSSFGYYVMLQQQQVQTGTSRGKPTYTSEYEPPWSGVAWALSYSFPPIPTGTSGYEIASGNYAPTYQITTFLNDYNTPATGGTTALNSSSNLVMAVGGVSNCGGLLPSSYDGNNGTYYPGAIYAAQAALLKHQTTHANSDNVMIILGDGNADVPSSDFPSSSTQAETTYGTLTALNTAAFTKPSDYLLSNQNGSGNYPSPVGQCGQAVTAGQYAANYTSGGTANNTLVFTIAYGASAQSNPAPNGSGACDTDVGAGTHAGISPCQTLQQIATQQSGYSISPYFYSDYTAQGGDSGCQANSDNSGITAIADIYSAIAAKLTSARLIPNGTN